MSLSEDRIQDSPNSKGSKPSLEGFPLYSNGPIISFLMLKAS